MANREFLFCGKRTDNGEWVEGDLIQLFDGRKYIVNNIHGACIDDKHNFINTEAPFVCEVEPETVRQYTGESAYGYRFFEGDIIKYDDELMVIEWSIPDSGYVVRSLDGSNWETVLGQIVLECAEIIGNIHDNPEILEGQT